MIRGIRGHREFTDYAEKSIDTSSHILSNLVLDIGDRQARDKWYILSTGTTMDGDSTISQGSIAANTSAWMTSGR